MLELDFKVPIADPMKCISKIANKANLTERTTREAMKMMTEIVKREISAGKHPMSIAATVLYMSSIKNGDNITQAGIANAAGVTEVTVRNRIKELNSKLWQRQTIEIVKAKCVCMIDCSLIQSSLKFICDLDNICIDFSRYPKLNFSMIASFRA